MTVSSRHFWFDNISIHNSNKVKAAISKYHPRIHPVFLPTSPELNLIEVRRWLWMHTDKQ